MGAPPLPLCSTPLSISRCRASGRRRSSSCSDMLLQRWRRDPSVRPTSFLFFSFLIFSFSPSRFIVSRCEVRGGGTVLPQSHVSPSHSHSALYEFYGSPGASLAFAFFSSFCFSGELGEKKTPLILLLSAAAHVIHLCVRHYKCASFSSSCFAAVVPSWFSISRGFAASRSRKRNGDICSFFFLFLFFASLSLSLSLPPPDRPPVWGPACLIPSRHHVVGDALADELAVLKAGLADGSGPSARLPVTAGDGGRRGEGDEGRGIKEG